MLKLIFIILSLLLIEFQYQLWWGRGGILDNRKLHHLLQQQLQVNEQLQYQNDKIASRLHELKSSAALREARARLELNLIRSDEILVILPSTPHNE